MKTLTFFLFFGVIIAMPVLAQEEETLIRGTVESGGFGGPVVKFTEINDSFGVLVGGRGGWIINHTFVIGGGGYGLANEVKVGDFRSMSDFLNFGYGGLELEYLIAHRKLIHFSVQALIGAGGVSFRDRHFNQIDGPDDAFFIAEPGVNVILNVTKSFRMGFGGSYRFIGGAERAQISDSSLSGPTALLTFMFGKF